MVTAAVEGAVDEAVVRRLAGDVGLIVAAVHGRRGKPSLLKRVAGYNQAARHRSWFVLVDLDQREDCAPSAREVWLPEPAPSMCFRIAVRAVEAWLLADRPAMAKWLSIAASKLPTWPEAEPDPKKTLIRLARSSRRREIREGLVPPLESNWAIGPAYTSLVGEFIRKIWRPEIAAKHADSLARCLDRLRLLGAK